MPQNSGSKEPLMIRLRAIIYSLVILMLGITIMMGSTLQRQRKSVREIGTPLILDEPSPSYQTKDALQDERISVLKENQENMTKFIAEATKKLGEHDVEFAQMKFYGYGMVGCITLLNALGFFIQWKKK